ncbi:MAG: signal peptidase I [Epulopiscium sp. Nele67-Bin005]|nr:MAG: signal peptidase I [Epulopiscium sp. Nele67-Bin005]
MNRELKFLRDIIIVMMFTILAIFGIQAHCFNLTMVYQYSMSPTLLEGDLLLTEKVSYMFKKPETGEIIIMLDKKPEGIWSGNTMITLQDYINKITDSPVRTRYVKRIVGVGGDTIDIKNGSVYLNEELFEEDYTQGETQGYHSGYPMLIPEGYVFVLGDNRENSLDSRTFGLVELSQIESKVALKIANTQ